MRTIAVTYLRAMTPDDLRQVLAIEGACFPEAASWDEATFRRTLRGSRTEGAVACFGCAVVGYSVHQRGLRGVSLLNLAVHPNWWRKGVGSQLLELVLCDLTRRRPTLTADVRERNLPCQLFLRAHGLRCVRVDRDAYGGEDGYHFSYTRGGGS